jgi:hypothetical protein
MNAPDWLAAYADKLGVSAPTTDELEAERIAAPVACWLAAKAGLDLDEALRLAQAVDSSG